MKVMLYRNHPWVPTGDNALIFDHLPNDNSAQTHSMREALKIIERLKIWLTPSKF